MVQLALLCFAALMGVVIANTELKLWTAAAEGDMTHVDEYLKKGTSPLWQNPDHYAQDSAVHPYPRWYQDSALHIASRNNHTEVVKRLLDAGVDVNLTNRLNQTAMIIASTYGYTDIVKSLIAKGAKVNLVDDIGQTPLHRVSRLGHTDTADLLIANDANVNLADDYGWTPLHRASAWGQTDTAALLIDNDANVNLATKHGYTPLHLATNDYRENTELVTLLISNGGEVNHVDKSGQTPLHKASFWGHNDTAILLITNGANPGITDKNGDAAGDISRISGYIELGNIIDSYTSTTVRVTSPATPAPNAKHEDTPRHIPLFPLIHLLHPTGQLQH